MHALSFKLILGTLAFLEAVIAQSYVEPPTFLGQLSKPIVPYTFRPIKVHSTYGTVANAEGIILDFGLDVGGYPVFEFAARASGENANIRYTVSESLAALEPGVGDGLPYRGNSGARFRSEIVPVSGWGERWIGTGIQGAQRFILIEHIGGTAAVSLNEVGFQSTTDITRISDLPGSFNSMGVIERVPPIFIHNYGIQFYSTAKIEAVAGSLLLFTGVQDAQGQISSSVPASLVPSEVPSNEWEGSSFYSLIYAISSANAWYEWYRYTGDNQFINTWWPAIKRGIDYGLTALDQETGLITVSGLAAMDFDYYDGPTPGTHIGANAIVVWALRSAALISESLGDSVAPGYRKTADTIESAVNKHLFSNTIRTYILVDGDTTVGISQDGSSYVILSGIANASSALSSARQVIEAMRALNTPLGLSFSNTSRFLPIVSPYASGFHTWAAFEAGMDDEAISLMRTVWKNQTDTDSALYTVMTWEFINGMTGEPFRPNDSSQAHGWGSGPTWQLSHYVLGVSPAAPEFSTWSFAPRTVNLTFANGRVPTPWGIITAAWEDTGSRFEMRIIAPTGTNETILIPGAANKTIAVNGAEMNANENATLPLGVTWIGADGSAYRVNVTSRTDVFIISPS